MEIDIEEEKMKIDPKVIWNFVILISIGVILTFSFLFISEVLSAKKGCEEIGGSYKLKSLEHLCDNKIIQEYQDGSWKIEQKPVNISEFLD